MMSARWWPGAMCSSITVSERAPVMTLALPKPRVPARLSEPMTRMLSAAVYGGRCLPSSAELTATRLMLPYTVRYLA